MAPRPCRRTLRTDGAIHLRDPLPDPTRMVELHDATGTVMVRADLVNAALADQQSRYATQATLGDDGRWYGPTGRWRPSNRIAIVDLNHLLPVALAA